MPKTAVFAGVAVVSFRQACVGQRLGPVGARAHHADDGSVRGTLLRLPGAGRTGRGQLLTGLCVGVFAFGGYLALMPSLTADYYGPKNMGANYGLVFTAFGASGFLVPKYFAHLVDRAKAAGDIGVGYNRVYLILAGMALVCALLSLALRPPRARTAA